MSEENPYRPPVRLEPPESPMRHCPDCGRAMDPGAATGTLYWTPESASRLSRFFLTAGKPVLGGSFRFTVSAPRASGHRCGNCGLMVIKPPV